MCSLELAGLLQMSLQSQMRRALEGAEAREEHLLGLPPLLPWMAGSDSTLGTSAHFLLIWSTSSSLSDDQF